MYEYNVDTAYFGLKLVFNTARGRKEQKTHEVFKGEYKSSR